MTQHRLVVAVSSVVLVVSLTLMWTGDTHAQDLPGALGPISVGSKVRLQASTVVQGPIRGTVMEMDRESLLVSTENQRPLRVSRQAITQLEVSTGRRGHARTGLIIGAVVGAASGAVVPLNFGCTQAQIAAGDSSCIVSRGTMITYGVLGDAGLGALIGHLIKSDRWSSVPPERIRVSVAPSGGRGARMSMSASW
jgi:hypothetical protein